MSSFEAAPYARLFSCAPPVTMHDAFHSTLQRYPRRIIELLIRNSTQIVPLLETQRYSDVSGALRRLRVDVDGWPVPPTGLFVIEERTVYLRSFNPLSIAHEVGHAIDCALGGGVYYSGISSRVRRAFAGAREFVTVYSATDLAEYFPEGQRAFIDSNDPHSPWPNATRERLRALDPALYSIVEEIFATGEAP